MVTDTKSPNAKISTSTGKLFKVKMEKISIVSYQMENSKQFCTKNVFHFYHRNEVFTALPGQTDVKDKHKKACIQNRLLND